MSIEFHSISPVEMCVPVIPHLKMSFLLLIIITSANFQIFIHFNIDIIAVCVSPIRM